MTKLFSPATLATCLSATAFENGHAMSMTPQPAYSPPDLGGASGAYTVNKTSTGSTTCVAMHGSGPGSGSLGDRTTMSKAITGGSIGAMFGNDTPQGSAGDYQA